MKNLLQFLLIAFALCGLVAFQWLREDSLRQRVQMMTHELQKQRTSAVTFSNSVGRMDAEIFRLRGLTNRYDETAKSGQAEIDRLKNELKNRAASAEELEAYKKALDTANARIAKQNEELKKLADDHNNAALQFNKLTEDYNELVKKWNAQQEELSKAATPTAANPPE